MNKKNWIWIALAIIVVVGGVLIYNNSKKPKDEDVIKIGAILPLTGELAVYGIPAKNGIDLAITKLQNDNTNIRIEVFYEDSKGEPKTAVTAIRKLITNNNVDFIVGDLLSSTTLAMASIANKEKVTLISPTASTSEINGFGRYCFSIYPSEIEEGIAVAGLAKKKSYENVGVIRENVPASEGMYKAFKNKFSNIAFDEVVESNQNDFKNIASKIKGKKFDAIFIITYSELAKKIVKSICEQGIYTDIISQTALYDNSFGELINTFNCFGEFTLTGSYYSNKRDDSLSVEFVDLYSNTYKKQPDMFAAQSYDATLIGVALLNATEGKFFESSNVNDFLFNGISGTFSFDETQKKGFEYYKWDAKEADFVIYE